MKSNVMYNNLRYFLNVEGPTRVAQIKSIKIALHISLQYSILKCIFRVHGIILKERFLQRCAIKFGSAIPCYKSVDQRQFNSYRRVRDSTKSGFRNGR